jgi:hypothetical protein
VIRSGDVHDSSPPQAATLPYIKTGVATEPLGLDAELPQENEGTVRCYSWRCADKSYAIKAKGCSVVHRRIVRRRKGKLVSYCALP